MKQWDKPWYLAEQSQFANISVNVHLFSVYTMKFKHTACHQNNDKIMPLQVAHGKDHSSHYWQDLRHLSIQHIHWVQLSYLRHVLVGTTPHNSIIYLLPDIILYVCLYVVCVLVSIVVVAAVFYVSLMIHNFSCILCISINSQHIELGTVKMTQHKKVSIIYNVSKACLNVMDTHKFLKNCDREMFQEVEQEVDLCHNAKKEEV